MGSPYHRHLPTDRQMKKPTLPPSGMRKSGYRIIPRCMKAVLAVHEHTTTSFARAVLGSGQAYFHKECLSGKADIAPRVAILLQAFLTANEWLFVTGRTCTLIVAQRACEELD